MNKWNQLLASLDQVFGMNNKERSTLKKLSQVFDEKTNEHVIVIEDRVRVKETVKSTPAKRSGLQHLAFLRQVMATQAKIRYIYARQGCSYCSPAHPDTNES